MNRFLRLFTNNVITLHPESQKFLEAARPGLGASALSGRVELTGRVEPTCKKFRQIKD